MRIQLAPVAMLAVAVAWVGDAGIVNGQNLLSGGSFEPIGGELLGWELSESIYDQTTMTDRDFGSINTAQQIGFDPQDGPFDLWLRPFAGGAENGPDNLTNAVLSQTVAAAPGVEYSFAGWSRFEANYGGGVNTLDIGSPLGSAASPTTTELQMEFIDGVGAVIGSPIVLDVKADRISQTPFPELEIANDNAWYQHQLTGTAPENAAQVRVTAAARQMVYNLNPAQSAFYDSFTLSTSDDPATELLTNGGIDDQPGSGLDFWTIVTDDPENPDNDEIIRTAGFANRTPGGAEGLWLSSFFGEDGAEVDGALSQTVPAEVGGEYTLTGWSLWEANYTAESTFMELAFLDDGGSVIGDLAFLDLRDEQMTDGEWRQHTVVGVAPEGAVSVRVTAGMENGSNPGANPQSAFFDDFVLTLATTGQPGDFNADGVVDGHDALAWQRDPSVGELSDWQANYGATTTTASTAGVPEPACVALLAAALAAIALRPSGSQQR